DALKEFLGKLEENERRLTEVQQEQKGNISRVKETFVTELKHIKQCFAEMGQFMERKERGLVDKLEARSETMTKEMEARLGEIQEALSSVTADIAKRKEEMVEEDDVKFLQGLSSLKLRGLEDDKALEDTSEDPSLEILKGPLQYSVWQDLGKVIKPGLTPLTLDPKTASPWLRLTPDLTGVEWAARRGPVPEDDPRRYNPCPCVLASQGFDSGCHYWEVRVAGRASWTLGVASERGPRRGDILLSPPNGYWAMGLRQGGRYTAYSMPLRELRPTVAGGNQPRVIGVYLDYGGGRLSFYDADGLRPLHTFQGCPFEGRLYPFFSLGHDHAGASPSEPLRLLNPLAAPAPSGGADGEACPCTQCQAGDSATIPGGEGAHLPQCPPPRPGPQAWLCLALLLALGLLAPGCLAESYLACCAMMGLAAWSWCLLDGGESPAVEVCRASCGALAYAGLWCLVLAYAWHLGVCCLALSLGGLMLAHSTRSGLALAPGSMALLGLLGLADLEVWSWWICCGVLGYAGLCLTVVGHRHGAEICWWCCGVHGYLGLSVLLLSTRPLTGLCWVLLGAAGFSLGTTGCFGSRWLWAGMLSYCSAWSLLLPHAQLAAVTLGMAGFVWSNWSHLLR
ncbi:hypothetical protein chiPu_0022126, partial [Chiloscyllium punctatum]|nr:hypothetical protein [Chiloscyllium punctatum]